MLRDDLGYRLTETGWEPAEGRHAAASVQPGWTATEVHRQLGRPRHIARQLLFHRYVEQWSYGEPESLWLDLGCHKGQAPVVLAVHRAAAP